MKIHPAYFNIEGASILNTELLLQYLVLTEILVLQLISGGFIEHFYYTKKKKYMVPPK